MFDIELGFHHGHKGEGGLKGKQNGHIDPRFMIRKCVRGDSQMTSAERGREGVTMHLASPFSLSVS